MDLPFGAIVAGMLIASLEVTWGFGMNYITRQGDRSLRYRLPAIWNLSPYAIASLFSVKNVIETALFVLWGKKHIAPHSDSIKCAESPGAKLHPVEQAILARVRNFENLGCLFDGYFIEHEVKVALEGAFEKLEKRHLFRDKGDRKRGALVFLLTGFIMAAIAATGFLFRFHGTNSRQWTWVVAALVFFPVFFALFMFNTFAQKDSGQLFHDIALYRSRLGNRFVRMARKKFIHPKEGMHEIEPGLFFAYGIAIHGRKKLQEMGGRETFDEYLDMTKDVDILYTKLRKDIIYSP